MALRLTTSLREQISLAVLRHRFSAEVGAAMVQRAALADDIYSDFYRKADREKMEALPDGWLPRSVCASAKFGEYGSGYAQLNFSGSFTGMLHRLRPNHDKPAAEASRRVLTKHQHACWKVYAVDHKLAVRYGEIGNLVSDLESRVRTSEKQIETALNAVYSAAALVKAWPEIEPFVTPLVPVVRALPALPVSALNETFKLPVKKAA